MWFGPSTSGRARQIEVRPRRRATPVLGVVGVTDRVRYRVLGQARTPVRRDVAHLSEQARPRDLATYDLRSGVLSARSICRCVEDVRHEGGSLFVDPDLQEVPQAAIPSGGTTEAVRAYLSMLYVRLAHRCQCVGGFGAVRVEALPELHRPFGIGKACSAVEGACPGAAGTSSRLARLPSVVPRNVYSSVASGDDPRKRVGSLADTTASDLSG